MAVDIPTTTFPSSTVAIAQSDVYSAATEIVDYSTPASTPYTYTVTVLDGFGSVEVQERFPPIPGFENDYLGVLTGYQSTDGFTVQNRTENGGSNVFTWLFLNSVPVGSTTVTLANDGSAGTYVPQCFAGGTTISTVRGDVAVEDLVVGDLAVCHDGAWVPVVWLGRFGVDCSRHGDPCKVWPVRVAADAFGAGQPRCDVLLSPDHAVWCSGVLIPIGCLLNGTTVAQVRRDAITYFHVGLARHDVVLADGLPCESFLDAGLGERGAHGASVALRWEAACAPLVVHGPRVDAERRRLMERAGAGLRVVA